MARIITTADECPSCAPDVARLKGKILDAERAQSLADKLKLLSDPTRLQITNLLLEKELCVCVLMDLLDKPQSNVSHHLAKMRAAKLVKTHRDGNMVIYGISDDGAANIVRMLTD